MRIKKTLYNNIISSADIKDYVNKYVAHFQMIINNRESCRLFTVWNSARLEKTKAYVFFFLKLKWPKQTNINLSDKYT